VIYTIKKQIVWSENSGSWKAAEKNDKELWPLISKMIVGSYLFVRHAEHRLKDRNISDLDVLDILENKEKRKRKRNKQEDKYVEGYLDWNYCIEGLSLDREKIRIIVSFNEELMLVITVIRLGDSE